MAAIPSGTPIPEPIAVGKLLDWGWLEFDAPGSVDV